MAEVTPVAIPGTIQSFGFLLAVDPPTAVIEVASENLEEFLGVLPADALGRSLTDVLGGVVAQRLPGASGYPGGADRTFRTVRLPPVTGDSAVLPPVPSAPSPQTAGAGQRSRPGEPWRGFEVVGRWSGRLWVLEFEPAADHRGLRPLYDSFRRALDRPTGATDGAVRGTAAADELRLLTGFDRVLVSRFDTSTQGEIIAESHRPDLDPYRGPLLTLGDTPRPTEGAGHNTARLVADVDGHPVRLLGRRPYPAGAEVDLTTSSLATVSAGDRRSLHALGVAAVLTVPLVIDGRPWGLLSCYHNSPRLVAHDVRAACEILARFLSLEIRSEQTLIENDRLTRLGGLVVEVVTAMSLADSLAHGAAEAPDALLGMVAADGVVLRIGSERVTAGLTPPEPELDQLVTHVAALVGEAEPPWMTNGLPYLLHRAGTDPYTGADRATGVLFIPFSGRDSGYALWLRAPQDPPAGPGSRPGYRATSRPWLPVEGAAAQTFAHAIPALLLSQAQRVLVDQELAASADRLDAAAEREQLEHQLQQRQRLESLGQLAGGVAHDFNNLLGVILNYVEFIGEEVDAEARAVDGDRWRSVQADIEQVNGAARRATDLTRQLLTFARREVAQPKAVDLDDVVRRLQTLLRRTIGEHVALVTELAGDLRPILADRGQLEQILVNLAVNARDAMPRGGTITITTANVDAGGDPGSGPGTARVRLQIQDSGTGMSRAVADRVFEPFFTTKATGDGTGLGLATVHGIVVQAHGSITVDSVLGRGTTFTVHFPATAEALAAAEILASADQPGGGETILIVEDGNDLREVTRRVLSRAGYDVLAAADGHQALQAAADRPAPVDLLLSDLIMPLMPGDEVAARFEALYPGVRILFMSGYAAPALVNGDGTGPRHPVLDKPFTRDGLLMKVREILDEPRTGPPARTRRSAATAGADQPS